MPLQLQRPIQLILRIAIDRSSHRLGRASKYLSLILTLSNIEFLSGERHNPRVAITASRDPRYATSQSQARPSRKFRGEI